MAAERFVVGLGRESGVRWADYLTALEGTRAGTAMPAGFVPATFLLAEVAGVIVGRASIRHDLDDDLWREGGHIGFCVPPPHRRRGHAVEILRQSVLVARAAGAGRVLVTCDDGNVGSRRAIEVCGGRLDPLPGSPAQA